MSQKQSTNDEADRGPLQFTTRSLLVAVAVCAGVLVIFEHAGPVWGVATVWFLVLVAAHVGANVRGSRESRRPTDDAPGSTIDGASSGPRAPLRVDYAPVTRLHGTAGPGRVLAAVTASGAVLGLVTGTLALAMATLADLSGILLGGISAGVVGGILGFVGGSFVIVSSRAFQEAAGQLPASSRTPSPYQAAKSP